MHIPDNYLSPETCAVMTAAMAPVWAHAVYKVKKEITREKMPMLGVGAAFSFTGMMFNVPLPGGTTGHAVGGTLIAGMLGPAAACISVTIALLIQALIFGDGGILAFGANCFNMAFILPYVGYAFYRLFEGRGVRRWLAAALGAYIGLNAAALAAAIEFGLQPALFTDGAGQPLYCPYGLSVSIPAMMIGHLTLFGAAEFVFTAALFRFMEAAAPDLMDTQTHQPAKSRVPIFVLLGLLICAVPVGLLAEGTAWGEWELSEVGIPERFGFPSLFPDYSMAGLPDVAAYILSAVIGVGSLVLIFRLIASRMKAPTDFSSEEE